MKARISALVAVFTAMLPLAALAWDCNPGTYKGKTWSVTKELSGLEATLTVAKQKDLCAMKFTTGDGSMNELWELKDNRMRQRERDPSGKVVRDYDAVLEVRGGVEGYYIECTPKGCDASADNRYFWRISTPGEKLIYSVWGVSPDKQSDPKAKAQKRHEYTFTMSK